MDISSLPTPNPSHGPSFVCIARTTVEWKKFLDGTYMVLGRAMTATLDKQHLPLPCDVAGVAEEPAFIACLSEFTKEGRDVFSQLRKDELVRRHVQFTFLINLPKDAFFILASFGLCISGASDGDYAVVSGRLGEWVHAVVQGTHHDPLRKFFCLMLCWFEQEDLGQLWSAWWKQDHADGTFTLEPK